jgi:hypothetical protein
MRVYIHMKEISRKCLIFPGSSPLIKSWKKLLVEVLNAYDDDDDDDNDNDNDKSCLYTNQNDVDNDLSLHRWGSCPFF